MRLACAAGFQQVLDELPCADVAQLEQMVELITQLRSGGYSGSSAALVAEQVLNGAAAPPRVSTRFARVYGD